VEIGELEYPDFIPGPVPEDKRAEMPKAPRAEDAPRGRTAGPEAVWKDEGATVDAEKFPGGVAPSGPPRRRLGGRMKSRRGR